MSDEFLDQAGVKALLQEQPAPGDAFLGQEGIDRLMQPFPLAVAHHGKTESQIREEEERAAATRFAQMALDPTYAELVREYAEFRGKAAQLAQKHELPLEGVLASIQQ